MANKKKFGWQEPSPVPPAPHEPETWTNARVALHTKQQQQTHPRYPWQPGETPITDAHFAELDETRVTPKEIAAHAKTWRGQYTTKDTRGFVRAMEQQLLNMNAYMTRDRKGSVTLHSEHPDVVAKRAAKRRRR